jgi:hypothetical protein
MVGAFTAYENMTTPIIIALRKIIGLSSTELIALPLTPECKPSVVKSNFCWHVRHTVHCEGSFLFTDDDCNDNDNDNDNGNDLSDTSGQPRPLTSCNKYETAQHVEKKDAVTRSAKVYLRSLFISEY